MAVIDNTTVAKVLTNIGHLLEIQGANPFKIRAYRNAADMVGHMAERVADLTDAEIRTIPGIGKDLTTKIRELVDTGSLGYYEELRQEFPLALLDLLSLQGVGPKTVAVLYRELGIDSLDALETAAGAGHLRGMKGMGARKEQLLLRAITEHRHRVGRHLIGETHAVASEFADYLLDGALGVTVFPVGSLRRGCETCGDVDLLAVGANDALMTRFTSFPGVDRILAHGTTKSSILLHNTVQADLRLVAPESTGAAAQYFTGSKSHNIALRDLALQRGLKLNEYGLFRESDDRRLAGDTESEIYETLGLAYVPPELREHRGELFAAASGDLPALIERADLKGDLHCHTTATDGKADVETMAHARHVRDIDARVDGVALLAGIECDILADGTLDLSEDCLAELDLVVASVHSAFEQDELQMTDRLLRAIESPVVDVMGHLTGRLLLRREPYRLRHDTVFDAAARLGVALEINSQTHRLDLSDIHARMARERGVKLVITTDAHAPSDFDLLHWGILVARRAWASPADVMNTQSLVELRASLRRHQP